MYQEGQDNYKLGNKVLLQSWSMFFWVPENILISLQGNSIAFFFFHNIRLDQPTWLLGSVWCQLWMQRPWVKNEVSKTLSIARILGFPCLYFSRYIWNPGTYMYVCVPLAFLLPLSPEVNVRFPATGIKDGYWFLCGCWKSYSGPLYKSNQC